MAILTIGLSCYDQFFFIPHFPEENRKVFSTELLESGGGPCGNASYLLGLWKTEVYHITTLKNDIYGQHILDELRKVNVNVEYSLINQKQTTPLSSILINEKTASRTIITHKNNSVKDISDIEKERLDQLIDKLNKKNEIHIVLIDGHEYELSEYIIPRLKNKKVVMDAGNVRSSNLNLAKYTNYLVASENFAQDLIGEESLSSKDKQLEALNKIKKISADNTIPIITLGENGVISLENEILHHYSAYQCNPIDTTGAGDIFHGAFVYGLYQKWDLEKIIYFSSLVSAISIERKGVRHVIPTLDEVKESALKLKFEGIVKQPS